MASANIIIIEQLGREDIVEEVFASGVYNGNIREDSWSRQHKDLSPPKYTPYLQVLSVVQ